MLQLQGLGEDVGKLAGSVCNNRVYLDQAHLAVLDSLCLDLNQYRHDETLLVEQSFLLMGLAIQEGARGRHRRGRKDGCCGHRTPSDEQLQPF